MGTDPLGPYVPWNPPGTFFDGLLQKGMQAVGTTVQSAIAAMHEYMDRPPTTEPVTTVAPAGSPDMTLAYILAFLAVAVAFFAMVLVLTRTRPRPAAVAPGGDRPVVWRIS